VCRRRELSLGFCRELQEAVVWMSRYLNNSTEAKHCDGTACSSDEVSVMEVEQRSSVRRVLENIQLE
jgi:hypothetical protein